jgi:hypothetical protein
MRKTWWILCGTALALLVLAAVAFVLFFGDADERRAVEVAQRLGGKVSRDEKGPGGPGIIIDLNETQATDADLKNLAGVKKLRALHLRGTKVTDAGLKELAGLPQLQTLGLRGTKVTDAGLKELAGLPQLQDLDLTDSQVTDAGLKELAGLKQLRALRLGTRQLAVGGSYQEYSAAVGELVQLQQLETLELDLRQSFMSRGFNVRVIPAWGRLLQSVLQRALPRCRVTVLPGAKLP